jgi:23S rRNA (guanosine2251-2'-O)-methyltransferase
VNHSEREVSTPFSNEAPSLPPRYLFGIHPVMEGLFNGISFKKVYLKKSEKTSKGSLARDERIEKIVEICKKEKIQFFFIDETFFEKELPGKHHQGVAAELSAGTRYYPSVGAFLQTLPSDNKVSTILLLDQVTDQQNLGAIARSALFFGVDLIVQETHHASPVDEVVHRISSGASLAIPFCRVEKLSVAINELKEAGYWIAASDLSEIAKPLDTFDPPARCALILGSEGSGVRAHLLRMADAAFSIRGVGMLDSLNVGAAGAIFLQAIFTKHSKSLDH